MASLVLSVGVFSYWLWNGPIPEKYEKDVGLGLTLPTYLSGSASISWWAMCITMLADLTAFISLVFGYFFYWTIHDDFPPQPSPGPGLLWPLVACVLLLGAWALTILARRWNVQDKSVAFYTAMVAAFSMSLIGGAALLAGPWVTGLDPREHVYPATVWLLVLWTEIHVAVGMYMQTCFRPNRCGMWRYIMNPWLSLQFANSNFTGSD